MKDMKQMLKGLWSGALDFGKDAVLQKIAPRTANYGGTRPLNASRNTRVFQVDWKTLKDLSQTDPVMFSIKGTVKGFIKQLEWDIVPDIDYVKNELKRWRAIEIANLNKWGLQDHFDSDIIDVEMRKEVESRLKKIIADTKYENSEKISQVRWVFNTVERMIEQQALKRCYEVRKIFEHPNENSEKTMFDFLEKLLEDQMVFDAGVIGKVMKDGRLQEKGLYLLPGNEVVRYMTDDMETPEPPNMAYVWEPPGEGTKAEYTADEIVYQRMYPQYDGYGFCVPFDTSIETENGRMRIGDLVNKRIKIRVKTWNEETERIEYRPVVNWFRRTTREQLIRVQFGYTDTGRRNVIRATPQHPILTESGWKTISSITIQDKVLIESPLLSAEQKQIIWGTLLGDASLKLKNRNGRNKGYPVYTVAHSDKQRGYLSWIEKSLKSLKIKGLDRKGHSPHYPERETSFRIVQSKAVPVLSEFYKDCYVDGKKKVTARWLDKIEVLGLATWFMDDGSVSYWKRGKQAWLHRITFCTDGFSRAEVDILKDMLLKKFGIEARIQCPPSTKKNRLVLSPNNAKKFLGLINSFV